MSTVKDILADRQETHGNYEDRVNGIATIVSALTIVYKQKNGVGTEPTYKLVAMWHDIALKLVRSAANPDHKDNWDDLAGYAVLIQELMGTQKEEIDGPF